MFDELYNLDNFETGESLVKKETRGRHKKNCNCDKCVSRYGVRDENGNSVNTPQEPKEKQTFNSSASNPTFDVEMNVDDAFDNAISTFKNSGKQEQNGNDQSQRDFEYQERTTTQISGLMLLTIIDMVAPFLMVKIFGFFDKKYAKVDTLDMKLDAAEKKDLEEVADIVAKEYVNMSPSVLLVVCLGSLYFTKMQINAAVIAQQSK